MCTLTWRAAADGYDLFFNRDELDTRAPETPPVIARLNGVDYLAPHDGERGGTWIFVNAYGLCGALLNDYFSTWRPPSPIYSRGLLALTCASATNLASLERILAAADLGHTGAFHFFAANPHEPPRLWHWDGNTLDEIPCRADAAMLTSSSFRPAEVAAARQERYALLTERSPATLTAYHHQHDKTAGAFSVLMRRPNARTRSITQVTVDARRCAMRYEPIDWDQSSLAAITTLSLPRA